MRYPELAPQCYADANVPAPAAAVMVVVVRLRGPDRNIPDERRPFMAKRACARYVDEDAGGSQALVCGALDHVQSCGSSVQRGDPVQTWMLQHSQPPSGRLDEDLHVYE